MKIYHKKNFAEGLFFTLLGAAFIVLFLVNVLCAQSASRPRAAAAQL